LALLKFFVDTGNREVVPYTVKRLFSRLGKIAMYKKDSKMIERGRDVLKVLCHSGEGGNDAAVSSSWNNRKTLSGSKISSIYCWR
jgi:hypothetical protein